ncbi:bifunctional DNA primase/polymerase [Sphingopyxis sp. 22461]|uniref:bifunctional DNA primase/polymerase n=1 Tax=Sphingopyxis sp. 22461 TaxID=3453923 RepID=UPI003F84E13F
MKNNNPVPSRFKEAAEFGFHTFPVKEAGKTPAVASWKTYAERAATPDELCAWDANKFGVAIVTGAPSGIVVLDVDSAEAQALVDSWDLPPTPCVSTGRGRHYYFGHPGFKVGNSVRIAGTKLDIRGDGGYVVGAGSVHESGAMYEWLVSPDNVQFADLPTVVLDQLKATKTHLPKPTNGRAELNAANVSGHDSGVVAYLLGTQRTAVTKISEAPNGERNDTLFRYGARLASKVAAAGADWEAYSDALVSTAFASGLEATEIERTLASCWKSGSENPDPFIAAAMKWVYLSKPNAFYHLESGQLLDMPGFNNTHAHLIVKGKFGEFLLSERLVPSMFDFVFDPQKGNGVIEKDGLLWLNTYRGSDVEAIEGDAGPFEEFISYLVPSAEERQHLLQMMAWTVRHPGKKLRHALLLRSEHQGVGKTMLTEIWAHILGSHNVRKSTTEEITGPWQGFLMNTLLIVLEELNLGTGLRDYNKMKEFITNDIVKVNEKYQPNRNWHNVASFVMLTNLAVPLHIEASDRRIFFIDSPALPRDRSYYADFAAWWQSNLGVIKSYLGGIDLESFSPDAPPPMTVAKQALIADSRTDLARDLELEINLRTGVFERDVATLAEIEAQLGRSMHGKTKVKLTEALRTVGAVSFQQQRVPGCWGQHSFIPQPARASLWAIRNADYWSATTAQDRGEEYARTEGMLSCFAGFPLGISHSSSWPGSMPWHVTKTDVPSLSDEEWFAKLKRAHDSV